MAFSTAAMSATDFQSYLERHGINIFVTPESHAHIDGIAIKHRGMECHVYKCMAYLCATHAFRHSKFNKMFDRRRCFLQFQRTGHEEVHLTRMSPLSAELVTVKEIPIEHDDDIEPVDDENEGSEEAATEMQYEFEVVENEMVSESAVVDPFTIL